ncbi:hypothetical protein MC885_021881, partial [Smutsia gigantea]
MQMNKSQNVDLKEFSFTSKPSLPSISRPKYLNIPELSVMEPRDTHEICAEVPQQEPSEYQDKEVLNVNFELGDEVWDDFNDEDLMEVTTSFSANTEKTKTSGFGNTLSSSTRGSKLSLQESKSKFEREISNRQVLELRFGILTTLYPPTYNWR